MIQNIKKLLFRWKEIIFITLIVRILLFSYSAVFANTDYVNLFEPWVRWDGPHYIDIAKNGYQTTGEQALFIVFYPLYPILIKIMNFLVNDFFTSAILVSLIFSLTASIALYELVLLDFNRRVAFLAVWFLNIFPTSYFLQASYTESLFLTTSLLTIYFFRKKLNTTSGIFGALSSLTRVNGMILLPLLLLEIKNLKGLVSLILLPIGFFIYLGINFFIYGSPLHFTKPLQENWYKKADYPWKGVENLINSIPNFSDPNFYLYFSEFVAILFIALMTVVVFFKVRKSYALYMFLNLVFITSTSFILSAPRYSMSLFPIFIALGLIKNKLLIFGVSLIFLSLLVYFTYLYTQGKWAF